MSFDRFTTWVVRFGIAVGCVFAFAAALCLSTYIVPGTTQVTTGCGNLVVLEERPDWLPEDMTLVNCVDSNVRYMVPTTLVTGHQTIKFVERQITEYTPPLVPHSNRAYWRQSWQDTLVIDGQTVVTKLYLA